VRLHEEQRRSAGILPAGSRRSEAALKPINVRPQYWREVRIRHRRVRARHELDQTANFRAHADLREANFTRDLRQSALVLGVGPAVHARNRRSADTIIESALQLLARVSFIERR